MLSVDKRSRIVYLFDKHNLSEKKKKFEILSDLAKKEDIIVSHKSLRILIEKWSTTGK